MYSIVQDYVARWIGVTLLTALAATVTAFFVLKLEMNAWKIAALVGLSFASGTLHVVLFARKRKAAARNRNAEDHLGR